MKEDDLEIHSIIEAEDEDNSQDFLVQEKVEVDNNDDGEVEVYHVFIKIKRIDDKNCFKVEDNVHIKIYSD